MVRLIKKGRKIEILPPLSQADEEGDTCPDCKEKFDGYTRRRCSYAGQVTCLDCVRKSKTGCVGEQVPSSSNVTESLTGCPTLTTSGTYENGQKDDKDVEPPILEKEEEVDVDIDVENGESDEDDQFRIVLRNLRQGRKASHKENQLEELSSSSRMGKWPCKHCNHLSMSKASLDEHLTIKHCSEGPIVATQKRLDIHLKTRTVKERPFQCYLCGQSFNRMFHLVRHMEARHRDQVRLLSPVSSKTSGGVRCPVCKSKFQSHRTKKYSLLRRAKNARCDHICCLGCIAKMGGSCSLCISTGSGDNVKRLPQKERKIQSFRFQQTRRLVTRNRNRHSSIGTTARVENVDQISKGKGTPKVPPECWECQRCGFTYCRPFGLQRHVESAHKDIVRVSPGSGSPTKNNGISQCPKCNVHFEILKHSRYRRAHYVQCEHSICLCCVVKEDLTCSQCAGDKRPISSKIQSKGSIRTIVDKNVAHGEVKAQENLQIEQEGRFRCLICDFTFSRHLSFERHLGRMHGVELVKSEEQNEGKEGKCEDLYCPECQEEFGPNQENQKAKYTECGHTSCLKCILKAELGCGKCTTENDPRWIHVSTLESPAQEKELSTADILCESQLSPTSFKRSAGSAGARKRRIYKTEQSGQLNGEVVGRNSLSTIQTSPSKISRRLRNSNIQLSPMIQQNGSKMPEDGRPQPSLKKTNTFVVQNKKHLVHGKAGKKLSVGMKVTRCNYCGKSFMGKRARNLHIQKLHSSDRHHICNYCKWKCQSPRDLQRHILQHTKEKPFKCNLCTAAFTRKFTLEKHMKQKHLKNQRY